MFALRRVVTRSRPPTSYGVGAGAVRCIRPTARRTLSSLTSLRPGRVRPRLIGTLALTGLSAGSAYLYFREPILLDASSSSSGHEGQRGGEQRREETLPSLLRTYIVYTMCSIPWLVDNSPKILDVLMSIPIVKQVTKAFVRATFFAQFVGGDTAQDMFPVLKRMRKENRGAIIHFSAEVDEHASSSSSSGDPGKKKLVNTEVVDEFIRCIDTAGDFEDSLRPQANVGGEGVGVQGRKTFFAMKLTALTPDSNTLLNFSKHLIHERQSSFPSTKNIPFPGAPRPTDLDILSVDPFDLPPTCPLTKEDLESLNALKDELFRMCRRAKERGIGVCVDAEHSWYQPAIEAFQLALMREFNRIEPSPSKDHKQSVQPQIYGTFQTYLRRAPEHLEQALRDAEEGGYAIGVKLVRGAYHHFETSSHSQSHSPDPFPPVWSKKSETDECFNKCARMLVRKLVADVAEEEKHGQKQQGNRKKGRGSENDHDDSPVYVPRLALIFGTHNPGSCELVLDALVEEGLARRRVLVRSEGDDSEEKIEVNPNALRRVCVGQLYGMCDALSSSLTRRVTVASPSSSSLNSPLPSPFVIKCTPYGPLERVMPYLIRRALENKSVLSGGSPSGDSADARQGAGGAQEERERARKEIARRVKRLFGLV